MNSTEGALRALEDELHRRSARGAEYADLAREVGLPLANVRTMIHRATDRRIGPRRDRDRRVRRSTEVETFEERDLRLESRRMGNDPWSATKVRKRLDEAADTAGQNAAARDCPVCRRRFTGRADRITCTAHCRDLARRIRQDDPSAEAAVRMMFTPPACAGCGEPLWARRPDAKHHGAACVKRRQRNRRNMDARTRAHGVA